MATESFFKRFVVKDDEAMENLIRAYEKREPLPEPTVDYYLEGLKFLEKYKDVLKNLK